jgi:hypothetical protein
MCVLEAFAVCSSTRSILAGQPGLPGATKLEPAQVRAIMARLPFEQRAFLSAVMHEDGAESLLWGWLYQKAAQRASQEHWELVRGVERIGWLARVVCADMLRLDGKPSPVRTVAQALGMARTSYTGSLWPRRYVWLGFEGERLTVDCKAVLRKEIYEG